jgi:photosystem II stability/assembly factor-like uncharacterized protein
MYSAMRKLKQISFLSFIFIVTVAFNFQHNPSSNWYQQFLPNIGSRQITDITFKDSLTGYATAYVMSDTSYVLKTTNGGDNWEIIYRNFLAITKVQFLDRDTGYAGGGYLYKTTNGGFNWNQINNPPISVEGMYILNKDTIWVNSSEPIAGGVYRTTNGGINWTQQYSATGSNPDKIYMFNARIGFICNTTTRYIRKTTDGGNSWNVIMTNDYFMDIHFVDSLVGWKNSAFGMKKTTNGGVNWVTQSMPSGGIIVNAFIYTFSNVNKDTIWGSGGYVMYPNGQTRGVLLRTTNGGDNWQAQVADTSIHIAGGYPFVRFVNSRQGWSYQYTANGIHTKLGGDTSFLTAIKYVSSEIPTKFSLHQNYPNPFNPNTKINYELQFPNYVVLKIFDLQGKEIAILVNQKQTVGIYSVDFDASKYNLSSGIYFYTLQTENFKDTKKMMLLK